mgnify:CR=1 FL=1
MAELGDLEVFTKVVTNRSMSGAGRLLGMSPAMVSKRIKRLEERLGTRLLQRTTRQITVTEAGQLFYDRVVNVIAGLEEAEQLVSGRSAEITGTLRISAPTSFGRMHIAPHLLKFMTAHPRLAVDIILSDEFADIVAGGFDLAVRIAEPQDSSLVSRRLVPARRMLCAAPDYLARHGQLTSIADLDRHQCLPAHNGDPWRLHGPDGALIYRPKGQLATNSSEVVREAVIGGLGIALRSTWDIGEELRSGRLVQVLPDHHGSPNIWISAVYPRRRFLPAKVRSFIDYLAALYAPVPPWEA